jgi:hypothetical protein
VNRRRSRHPVLAAVTVVLAALLVAACGASGPSQSASASAPSATAAAPATSAAPVASSTPAASAPSAPSAPADASAEPTECDDPTTTLALPSDRFTDIRVATTPTADRITFVFGEPSLPGPAEPPMGELSPAAPPYTAAGSGAEIKMTGDHVVVVGFATMSLQNDAGQETYGGPPAIKPDLPALKQAVLYDASEGAIGWYVGYAGDGCLAFEVTRDAVTLTIGHP